MDLRLLDILACPLCKGALHYDPQRQILRCEVDDVDYPIENGIPMMVPPP